jgi:glutaconate CoA-transferase subunit A
LLLVPALAPDIAVLHAQYGDAHGNLRIEGPPVADLLFARASRSVIATVERLVSTDELTALGGPNVAYIYVSAVAEVPFGAHPTACYPFYAYDRAHTALYHEAASAGDDAFAEGYLRPFVYEPRDHAKYVDLVGGTATRERLAGWTRGTEAWLGLYDGAAT